ncbi:MAG: efflux RND transporter periplasmic adaptor subunit [Bradymonadaceae bacterium]
MTSYVQMFVKYGLPLVVLVAAGAGTAALFASKEKPEREPPSERAAVVETATVERKPHRLDVRAHGTVAPARRVVLRPQVSGRIVDVSAALEPGARVDEGEVLVRIERDDYRLAVEQREAAVQQAESQLQLEKGQRDIAKKEWKLYKEKMDRAVKDPSLALRKPQLRSAKARVDSARAQLQRAKLNLKRTTIRAPFDAIVREEQAEKGDVVGTQSQLATLVGVDAFHVEVSVDRSSVPRIAIPGINAEKGSKATIRQELGGGTVERSGRVARLFGGLDQKGHMARLLVEIPNPLAPADGSDDGGSKGEERQMPLLLNAYVDVRLRGNTKRRLIELPRRAVRGQDQVYVYDDDRLAIRTLDIVWRRPESVLVDGGVEDGERVVTGPLPTPVEGMKLERAAENGSGGASGESGSSSSSTSSDGEGEQ